MSSTIYRFTRQIALVLSIAVSALLFKQGYYARAIGNLMLMGLFIKTSCLYQRRFNLISVPYIFIFINLYVVFSLVASYYDCNKIIELDNTGFKDWGGIDYYPIYFWSVFFAYICILIYLRLFCKTKEVRPSDISLTGKQIKNMYIGISMTVIAYFALGKVDVLILPGLAMILIFLMIDKARRPYHVFALLISLILFRNIFIARFYVIQIVFPAIVAFVMMTKKNEKKYPIMKFYVGFGIAGLGILMYGVVSEIIKLNSMTGGRYNIYEIARSGSDMMDFAMRQLYRLFIVWIKDGGYIIYHVQGNGFYYGLSYIKPLAGVLGLPYVSLPQIAAAYNYSTYSQTGLLAEGYANFGIVGAVINIVVVFLLMEYLKKRFIRKPSLITMTLMAVPFTKVLFDGGSLTSSVVLMLVTLLINVFNVHLKSGGIHISTTDEDTVCFEAITKC